MPFPAIVPEPEHPTAWDAERGVFVLEAARPAPSRLERIRRYLAGDASEIQQIDRYELVGKLLPLVTQPEPPPPSFREFVRDELGVQHVRRVYRVKRRTATFKGVPWGPNTALLTESEYDTFLAAYEARYGAPVNWGE